MRSGLLAAASLMALAGAARAQSAAGAGSGGALAEVVVTAQKREQQLLQTPVPVTSVSAQSLISQGQVHLEEYFSTIPGLSLTTRDGSLDVSIRGITTGSGFVNPTVGVIVDDAPFGSSTVLGGFENGVPQIDPADIARIEVLRGPQGTLYGASSLGGLIKFVTQDPSTAALTGVVQGSVSGTQHGQGAGYSARGLVNVPLNDAVAVRVSAFSEEDPGYIDNPLTNQKGINIAHSFGGRIAALWRISPDWTFRLSALAENQTTNGSPAGTENSGYSALEQPATVRNAGSYERDVRSLVASLKGRVDGVDVVAVTSYGNNHYQGYRDFSFIDGDPMDFGVDGAYTQQNERNQKITEELRLSGTLFTKLDWLAGAFYAHEDNTGHDIYYAGDSTTQRVGNLEDDRYPSTYQEEALFGDLTYDFTSAFNIQVGVRGSGNEQHYEETLTGFYYTPPSIQPPIAVRDTAVTYLVTPEYKLSPYMMVYSRIASGYRPGGPNSTCQLVNAPCVYKPDTTQNYEVGAKGSLFDKKLTYDASIYDIEWNQIQLSVQDANGDQYFINGSKAASRGVELSLDGHPFNDTTISGWATYDDAILTQNLPANALVQAVKGDPLPYTAPWTANVSATQNFRIGSKGVLYAGASASYIGLRKSALEPIGYKPLTDLHSYTQFNLQFGWRRDKWQLGLYANNITDVRGALSNYHIYPATGPVTAVEYIRPRTIGVNLKRSFGL